MLKFSLKKKEGKSSKLFDEDDEEERGKRIIPMEITDLSDDEDDGGEGKEEKSLDVKNVKANVEEEEEEEEDALDSFMSNLKDEKVLVEKSAFRVDMEAIDDHDDYMDKMREKGHRFGASKLSGADIRRIREKTDEDEDDADDTRDRKVNNLKMHYGHDAAAIDDEDDDGGEHDYDEEEEARLLKKNIKILAPIDHSELEYDPFQKVALHER